MAGTANIDEKFNIAVDEVRNWEWSSVPDKDKVVLYALMKQALAGDCNRPKPTLEDSDALDRAKWIAWNNLKGTDSTTAMLKYVEKFEILSREYVVSSTQKIQNDTGYNLARVDLHERITQFYLHHNPHLLNKGIGHLVDYALKKGEEKLNKRLRKEYGEDLDSMITGDITPVQPVLKTKPHSYARIRDQDPVVHPDAQSVAIMYFNPDPVTPQQNQRDKKAQSHRQFRRSGKKKEKTNTRAKSQGRNTRAKSQGRNTRAKSQGRKSNKRYAKSETGKAKGRQTFSPNSAMSNPPPVRSSAPSNTYGNDDSWEEATKQNIIRKLRYFLKRVDPEREDFAEPLAKEAVSRPDGMYRLNQKLMQKYNATITLDMNSI